MQVPLREVQGATPKIKTYNGPFCLNIMGWCNLRPNHARLMGRVISYGYFFLHPIFLFLHHIFILKKSRKCKSFTYPLLLHLPSSFSLFSPLLLIIKIFCNNRNLIMVYMHSRFINVLYILEWIFPKSFPDLKSFLKHLLKILLYSKKVFIDLEIYFELINIFQNRKENLK